MLPVVSYHKMDYFSCQAENHYLKLHLYKNLHFHFSRCLLNAFQVLALAKNKTDIILTLKGLQFSGGEWASK
jgi:hypothetical protein